MNDQQYPVIPPSLTDLLDLLKRDISTNLRCLIPGQIQSFDSSKFTATIQPLFKRVQADGTIQRYPLLMDVPVFVSQGGGAALFMPIAAGDNCLVAFADRNIGTWHQNGAEAKPPDARSHDLSDGFALVGVNSLSNLLTGYTANEASLYNHGAKVGLKNGLVTVANTSTTLLTALTNLITHLSAATIDTTHGVFTSATIANLATDLLTLQSLLY